MKTYVKVMLWFLFVCMCIGALVAGIMEIPVAASENDALLYHIGGSLLFIVVALGLLIELNIFHLREHTPLVRSKNIGKHFAFWIIVFVVAALSFAVCYGQTSKEFKDALNENMELQNSAKYSTTSPKKNTDKKSQSKDDINGDSFLQESGSNVNASFSAEDEQSQTVSDQLQQPEPPSKHESDEEPIYEVHDLDGEVFTFSDEVYTVNGAEITFHSLEYEKFHKPKGYMLTFEYSISNVTNEKVSLKFNDNECKFRFSAGEKIMAIAAQNSMSNKYASALSLDAGNSAENMKVAFNVITNTWDGVDIADLYSDEHIECDVVFTVFSGETSETFTLTFTFN